ncbi:reverse transcriptase family protein [Dysgonomonas capnocytophagoides]|uniref:reverse transcriptase family protein n=1 Tax=Dysgonomonas capnocytophagoides TaxID=45254 RepID=UPI000A030406|nr:reverse transcriptase family protein [Dysgonomonas capnocytophagoides]
MDFPHAFTGKKSIISNCRVHIGQQEILKIDLKDFFPSISFNRIIYFFRSLGYAKNISFYLAKLCTYEDYLPQGAPTSPILSNIIARKLDNRLIKFAQTFDLKYTRYADDIVFSGKKIPIKLIEYVNAIIVDEGFEVNCKKTRLYKKNNKKIITGIVINSDTITIPREYKRELKLSLNYILSYGLDSHISKKKIKDIHYLERILGKVNFWLQVEPDNEFAKKSKTYLLDEFRKKVNYT